MARSLNRVQLIGNLTRDPELRYTPNGTAVCSFGLATNRSWKTESGEKHDEAEFHNIVSWNKLAELCSQFLVKGRKVFVEGRLATRTWTGQDGTQRNRTEIVISDMILLDSNRGQTVAATPSEPKEAPVGEPSSAKASTDAPPSPELLRRPSKAMANKSEGQGKKDEVQKPEKKAKTEGEPTAASAKSFGPLRQSTSEASELKDEVAPDDIPF